ncbi:cytochrome-c oxidase subunit 2 [Gluconobacter morbifer]|uniref:Cytochrome-c oxidase subunit 2 n=1 Tax=Gluconobacter morbifer G707 TaxID=1088869 RepID=G6XJP3_9PROT|nr:cytochrome-c oxidase subunit 2 [Gluconobacter morbifer]EHH67855.1 cytochrome-c oxidase subunit 2 [Gluconobacter morbifer G707]
MLFSRWQAWRALRCHVPNSFPMLMLLLLLGGCGHDGITFLHPGGPVAEHQRNWLLFILAALSVVVVPVFIGVPYCMWRYRLRRDPGDYRPTWESSRILEWLVWGVPTVVVVILSLLILGPERRYSPANPVGTDAPLDIQVIGLNWKWLFLYPDQHVASLDTLALPQGREIRFHLTSDATMQSFFIPGLGSQIYAMAGMVTTLHLRADRTGQYLGENTQFNGMGFQGEKFPALVLSQADFTHWMNEADHSLHILDDAVYRRVLQPDGDDRDVVSTLAPDDASGNPLQPQGLTFSHVPDGFFMSVVNHYHQPPLPGRSLP